MVKAVLGGGRLQTRAGAALIVNPQPLRLMFMSIESPSKRKEFQGLSDFYDVKAAPWLRAREKKRKRAVRAFFLILVLSAVIAVGAYLGGLHEHVALIAFGLGAAIAGAVLARARADISGGLLSLVCEHLGFAYRAKLSRPAYYAAFDRLRLMPNFNREGWEDEVRGARGGADFVLCEAHLKYKTSGKNSSTRTVFHGQLVVIDYHETFLGETVIKRDRGVFNRLMKPGGRFQRVGLASPKFEKIFEAWSTDQVEARTLLDPVVLERFEELDRIFDGAKLRAAFSGGKLYVAMETGDKLNMGTMFQNLESPERVETIMKEFDLIFDLIDVLLKRIDGRLDGAFSVEAVRD